jgi:site-specific DNA recombinase
MIAATYARKSTEQNGVADEQKSVARQVENARAFAERKGWTVAEEYVFVDDGVSGAEFGDRRPGLLRLMNSLKPRPPFQVLIMSEESRLGRESIETAYLLKQIVQAGVRVWFYLEDRERTLDSPTDKIMLSLTAFADELEREKARQRTYDAMARKARAGHVTGGRVFGYDNIEVNVPGPDGGPVRSHVERRINEAEAVIVRHIFEQYAQGWGLTRIAKALNQEHAASPRAQQGRPQGWAPSSVREVLIRPIYHGELVWNRTAKRDSYGRVQPHARPASEWLRIPAPDLRIVPEDVWLRVRTRFEEEHRERYRDLGRSNRGRPGKYLLSGMLQCKCGSAFEALSSAHGKRRAFVYGCAAHRRRGGTVCGNGLVVPMETADNAILNVIESTVLQPAIVEEVLTRAFRQLASRAVGRRASLEAERSRIDDELARLTDALAAGGDLDTLVNAVRTREGRRDVIDRELAVLDMRRAEFDGARLRQRIEKCLREWRLLLRAHPEQGRAILRQLVVGRILLEPVLEPVLLESAGHYRFKARGTVEPVLSGVFAYPGTQPQNGHAPAGSEATRRIRSKTRGASRLRGAAGLVQNVASPTGFEPVFQP